MRPPTEPSSCLRGRAPAALVAGLLVLLTSCSALLPSPEPAPAPATGASAPPAATASAPTPSFPPMAMAPLPTPAPRDPVEQAARQFLAASERLRTLSNAELVREVVRLSEGPPSPLTTLEMALGLGLTRNPGDVARAIGVLDPLARSSSPDVAPWQPWARLLLARYAEQRRIEDQLDRQAQQLREQQRRIDQLNNQVEALKAIERSMAPRPAAPLPSPPPTSRGSAP